MEQTTGWNRLFGTAGKGSSPSFGAAAFGAVSRGSRGSLVTMQSSNVLGMGTSAANSAPVTPQDTSELIFERVDLMSVCSSLQLLINASSTPTTSDMAPSTSETVLSSSSTTSSSVNPIESNPGQIPSASASIELLEKAGRGEVFKDTILIRKCSLAEQENSKTSQFGNLIRALPTHFRNIVLTDCIMTEAAIASLCYGVLGSNHILSLTMKHNTLGSDRIKGIATGLVTNKVLEALEISFSDSIQLILPYLSSSIDDNHTLNTLALNNDRLTDIAPLTSSLKRLSAITSLDLSSNYLDRSQASLVAEMLLVNSTLQHLNLSSNVFGDHGAQLIALALEQNVGLKSLKLDSCSLLDFGVSSLGRSLRFNSTLTSLSLAGNVVSDLSSAAFIESLETHKNESLLELRLDGPTPHMLARLSEYLVRNTKVKAGLAPNMWPPLPADFQDPLTAAANDTNIQGSGQNPNQPFVQGGSSSHIRAQNTTLTLLQPPPLLGSQLPTLTDIHWNNRFALTPKTLADLFNLAVRVTHLNLSRCGISKLPPSITNLVSAKTIDLRSNHLRSLCPEIAACRNLEVLKLSDNHLESLPCELSQLTSLIELHLYGNPMTHIPDAVTRIDGILDGPTLDTTLTGMNVYRYHHVSFQQSVLMQYLKTIFQAKMSEVDFNYGGISVVGPEKSGKTALLNILAANCNKRFRQWESKSGQFMTVLGPTEGVSHKYRASNPDAPFEGNPSRCISSGDVMMLLEDSSKKAATPFHLICNDFHGSPAYKTLPAYLLGEEQTLYMIVFNLLEYPANQTVLETWIKTIVSRVGASNAAIIMVGTHMETKFGGNKNSMRDLLAQMRKNFKPAVLDVHFVDIKSKPEKLLKALAPLISSILTTGKSKLGWGQKTPASFLRAISQVLHLRDALDCPVVPFDLFQEQMLSCGIISSQMDQLISRLSSMGLIRSWCKDRKLKDHVFIDPSFLYSALSEIVGPNLITKVPTGTVGKKALDTMWSANTKPRVRPIVLKIVENFEFIAIDYTHLDERLTIPHLLPANSTNLSSYWSATCPAGMRMLQRMIEFSFVPLGFITKVIGTCLGLSQLEFASVWINGLVVRLGKECAKMEFNPETHSLSIQVVSESHLTLATTLFSTVGDVVKAWFENADPKISIPISVNGSGPGTKVLVSELQQALANLKDVYQVGGVSIPIHELAPDLMRTSDSSMTQVTEDRILLRKSDFGNEFKATVEGGSLQVLLKEAPLVADLAFGDSERGMALASNLTQLSKNQAFISQLTSLSHANLVRFVGLSHVPHLAIYSHYDNGQNLGAFIRENPKCSMATKVKILLDIAFATEHLHRQTPILLHGNIKPNNILVTKSNESDTGVVAKTTDYALMAEIVNRNSYALSSTSWMWQAPEVFVGGPMTTKSDVFSFGTLVWYLWSCDDCHDMGLIDVVEKAASSPFQEFAASYTEVVELQHSILRRNMRPKLPTDNRMRAGHATLELLVRACWKPVPEERPDFSSIIKKLVQIADHVRDTGANESPNGSNGVASKARTIYSVNMKQLQHNRTWQLLASYVFKGQPHTFSSATSVPFKIPPTSVSNVSKPTSLVPAPENALSYLSSSTMWLGSARNFVVLLDLKDAKTSTDLKLEKPLDASDRPTITFISASPTPGPSGELKKPTMRADSRGAKRSAPPPMLVQTNISPPGSPAPASPSSPPPAGLMGLAARSGSSSSPSPLAIGSGSASPAKSSTNQRIIGSLVVGVAIWSFSEDKTLTISLGPKVISKVDIGKHPICVTRSGDFGYLGCGEGIIMELDLTREPKPNATTIDTYLLRTLDVQGNPIYSLFIDETNVWVGTKGEVHILDRLSSHRYFSWVAHTDRIVSILKMPDGRSVWTASDDRSIKVWPIRVVSNAGAVEIIQPNQAEKTLMHHTQRIKDMILVGNNVVSIAGENSAIWDTVTGVVVKVLQHTGFANAVAPLDSNTIVTISSTYDQQTTLNDNYIQVWNNGFGSTEAAQTFGAESS